MSGGRNIFSKGISAIMNQLPKPVGERPPLQATARHAEGMPTRDELEREARDGEECEQIARAPAYLRFKTDLLRQIEVTQDQAIETLDPRQAGMVKGLKWCEQWFDRQISSGSEARKALEGMRNG